MHQLRDALLGPSPKGPPDLTGLDKLAKSMQDVRESVARQEFDQLRGSAFYNLTWIISLRYCNIGDGVDALEGYLHELWHIYYQLARHTANNTSEQDRLILNIVRTQGLGPLSRPVTGLYGIDIARTVEGTLWNDLPFLATDMTGFWIDNCAMMSGVQRLNLASFLAKLASTRVNKDRVCQIALVLFNSTFEVGRNLGSTQEPDNEDTHRFISTLDLTQLLPAACAWIKEAGQILVQLSDVSWNDCPSLIGQGGKKFVESELGQRSPTGFTPWRMMYWLKRLHQIQEEAREAKEKSMEDLVTDTISRLSEDIKTRNSGILRCYQNGGDVLLKDEHLACLKDKT